MNEDKNIVVNRHITPLFPSYLFKCSVKDLSICDKLETTIKKMWKEGKGTFVTDNKFISDHNLHDMDEFKELSDIILKEVNDILNFYYVSRESHYITCMWANVIQTEHTHMLHTHPNAFLSGTFYVKAPEYCGVTAFGDPRPANGMIHPDYIIVDEKNGRTYRNVPIKGDMLIWNSWLPHGVEHGQDECKEERIAVAFNIMIKGQVNYHTQAIVF